MIPGFPGLRSLSEAKSEGQQVVNRQRWLILVEDNGGAWREFGDPLTTRPTGRAQSDIRVGWGVYASDGDLGNPRFLSERLSELRDGGRERVALCAERQAIRRVLDITASDQMFRARLIYDDERGADTKLAVGRVSVERRSSRLRQKFLAVHVTPLLPRRVLT